MNKGGIMDTITVQTLKQFSACDTAEFAALYPQGYNVAWLWGSPAERAAGWRALLGDPFLRRHVGWAIEVGLLPVRIVANLRGADLTDANLTAADLTRADLTRANLAGADLTRANLTRAHLTGANLRRANLTDADLTDADLRRATLTGADLTDADLRRANLTGADLTRAEAQVAEGTK